MNFANVLSVALEKTVFKWPKVYLSTIGFLTIAFATQLADLRMYSDFADQLPQSHPYIQLHNEIKDEFGGANVIVVGIAVESGDIFTNDTLQLIHRVTQGVDELPGVNHNLVTSFTHRTTRKVWLTELGNIVSDPYYQPANTSLTDAELAELRNAVVANPVVYGPLISPDMKMALVKAQLNEGALDYELTFSELQKLREEFKAEGVEIYATGQPVLVGWAYFYKQQIFQILAFTALIMLALLLVHFRSAYGVLLPLAGVVVSSIWGLSIIAMLGYNLDPLGLVIPFLISARAMSHGIQIVKRYYAELALETESSVAAAKTFGSLFRPGTLGVVSDAIGLFLIAVGSIPLNTKLAQYASLWALCIIPTVLIALPVALSVLPKPLSPFSENNENAFLTRWTVAMAVRKPRELLFSCVVLVAAGLFFASHVTIGESEPGSPILYQSHDYNVGSRLINERFPGSEELYIVAQTDEPGGIKRPDVLAAIADFESHMMLDPAVGGAKGIPDLVKQVNRLLHNNDPRWQQIPKDDLYVGGLLFAYMASSPIPGALKEFIDPAEQRANLVFYYKDHQGETIRRAIHMAREWIDANHNSVPGLTIRLAGGTIGVTAAMDEAAFQTNQLVLPLVFLLIFVTVMMFYRSFSAGLMMLLAMSFATCLTYAYMGISGVGININTVPVIAVGIGVGIDYSIYMMDRIREERAQAGNLLEAVEKAIASTGQAISFTAATLIAGIIMWVFLSDLRFQSDAALLLSVMVVLNALAALLLVPAWVLVAKPSFIESKS